MQTASSESELAIRAALAEFRSVNLPWDDKEFPDEDWSLGPDTLRFLYAIVRKLRPKHILEFGSGRSTQLMAHASADFADECSISSVDHDPHFLACSSEQIADDARIRLQLAPLVAREFAEQFLPAYHIDPKLFASQRHADLILIDGPPATLGGREGVLYQVLDYCRPGSVVLLDDSKRAAERAALDHWKENLDDSITVLQCEEFAKGLAVILVNQPVGPAELEAHRLALTLRELDQMTNREKLVVAGSEYWDCSIFGCQFWTPPEDEASLIESIRQYRSSGIESIAFLWPAFWWFDYYPGVRDYLNQRFSRPVENQRLVLYDLTSPAGRVP